MDEARAQTIAQLQALVDSVPAIGSGESIEPRGNAKGSRGIEGARAKARKREARDDGGKQGNLPPDKLAYKRIVELCGYHEFCRSQLRIRLRSEGLPDSAIESALEKTVRIGLVDDLRWGEMRASALMRKGMGNAGIERELKQNGIDASGIAGWPYAYEERFGAELDRAVNVLLKSPPRSKNPRGAAYGKLMRKGYTSHIASKATAIWYSQAFES